MRGKKKRTKKGLRRESNPGHLHPKQILYHLTTKPSEERAKKSQIRVERKGGKWGKERRREKRSVRGRVKEPGKKEKKKKRSDPGGGRTHDLSLRRRMRFHCATGPSKRRGKKSVIRRKVGREGEREEKRGFAGNRTRATRTLSGYFTT